VTSGFRKRALCRAALVLLLGLATACGEKPSSTESGSEPVAQPEVPPLPTIAPPASHPDLLPIEPPDLTRVGPSARRQIEEEHALLITRTRAAAGPMMLGDAYGRMGMVYLASDFPDAAEPCFRNAQTLQPDEFRWPYYLGHLYRGNGRPDDAIPAFRRALELRPEVTAALVWLGRTYLEQGRDEEAGPLFRQALAIDPEASSALLGLGQVALNRQDYAGAVEHLEAALEYAPGADAIHYQLALAYRGLGNLEKAEEHLRERGEVDIYPYDPWMDELRDTLVNPMVHTDRGGRAYSQGLFEEAAEEFRKAAEVATDDALVHFNLGVTLMRLDDTAGASAELGEAVRLDPDMADAHYALGALAENGGRDDQARNAYGAAIRIDPDHGPAHMRLGQVERRAGQSQEAIEEYRAAIRINPRDAEARLGQLMALVALGRWAEAKGRMEEAVSALPEQPAFAHALARLLAASPDDTVRDGPRALQILQSLSASGPPTTDLGETIAMALAETGQFEQAASIQQAAIRAVEQAGDKELARKMGVNLAAYVARSACRIPWRDGNPLFEVPRDAEPPPPQRRPDLGG